MASDPISDTASSQGQASAKEKEKRAPRACLACRARKTRCDLDFGNPGGQPPCRRCVRDGQECVLVASRRGGRRVRRQSRHALETSTTDDGQLLSATWESHNGSTASADDDSNTPVNPPSNSNDSRPHIEWPPNANRWGRTQGQEDLNDSIRAEAFQEDESLQDHVTSTDLLNPSDALDLLARVASHDEDDRAAATPMQHPTNTTHSIQGPQEGAAEFTPISENAVTEATALILVREYHQKYHAYFPIVPSEILTTDDVTHWARKEPHVLAAILTVASHSRPDLTDVHAACSAYMERLISALIYGGSSSVGAVEALLILAEWAPQRLESRSKIGRGEEDHGAWMQVGCAIRLGYLQNLEQTGLSLGQAASSDPETRRKRLAWAACYMSDRQVSIRVGKGFWSRGPGPSTLITPTNLPAFEGQQGGGDDLALLFQAHMELTQLYSNARDVLYSSTSHREHLYLGGEYVRYIDDFAATLRKWQLVWGALSCTSHVKATLMLSYDFLRLYINAFAFQATISRVLARARQDSSAAFNRKGVFANIAGAPDARFIYESIDAANSLLSTLNSFIDPVTGLRHMPLKYYLYVIHAAVFLFKARAAGAIGADADKMVRRAVDVTISRFQQSSVHRHSLGYRYARLLYLLWHKPPHKAAEGRVAAERDRQTEPRPGSNASEQNRGTDASTPFSLLDQFSWRDLDSVGQFIAGDGGLSDSTFATPEFGADWGVPSGNFTDGGYWIDPMLYGTDLVF